MQESIKPGRPGARAHGAFGGGPGGQLRLTDQDMANKKEKHGRKTTLG